MKSIKTVGVVGAGQMGQGIAFTCATAGYKVVLIDNDQSSLARATRAFREMAHHLSPANACEQSQKDIYSRIEVGLELEALKASQLIIEAIPEDLDQKIDLLKKLDEMMNPHVPLCTNTSALSITRMASSLKNSERLVGLHFMNPAPLIPLVEVIRTLHVDEEILQFVEAFAAGLGKTFIEVLDTPAFVVNRLLVPMINEAIFLLATGVASAEDIDEALRQGAHHSMGPLELADMIGLDVCLAIMRRLHEGLGEDKYRPCPLLVQYVEAGLLGRKTGRGFFTYDFKKD